MSTDPGDGADVRRLRLDAGEAGDIIFVSGRDLSAGATRFGQRLIRLAFDRIWRPSSFSHVALMFQSGAYLHASPGVVRAQRLDILLPPSLDASAVRIVRRTEGLKAAEKAKLYAAALKYYDQPYGFWFGGLLLPIGQWIHAKGYNGRRITMPFCSQLVATAYEAISVDICRMPSNRVLPMDLERSCVEPDWRDVTSEYYPPPDPPLPAAAPGSAIEKVKIQLEEIEQRAAKWDRGLHGDVGVLLTGGKRNIFNSSVLLSALNAEAAGAALAAAERAFQQPALLFVDQHPALVEQLANIDQYYDRIARFPVLSVERTTRLSLIFPDTDAGESPYEGALNLKTLEEDERRVSGQALLAETLRLGAALLALAGVLYLVKAPPAYAELAEDAVLPLIAGLPLVSEARADSLLAAAEVLAPLLGDERELTVRSIRMVVNLHLSISTFLEEFHADQRPTDGEGAAAS